MAEAAEYVVTREQLMGLLNPGGINQERVREQLLLSILGRCESTWKDLRCIIHDGHHGYHRSGQVLDGGWDAWASWERLKVPVNDGSSGGRVSPDSDQTIDGSHKSVAEQTAGNAADA